MKLATGIMEENHRYKVRATRVNKGTRSGRRIYLCEMHNRHFDYRIAFDTFQHRNTGATLAGAGAVHFSGSEVKVYDNQDKALFAFKRETRYTDKGATNAAAKEIIKRLIAWRHEHDGQGSTKP